MKRCPLCHKAFADDLAFCLADGHKLEIITSQTNLNKETGSKQTLIDLINSEAPLAVEQAVRLAISICDAVEELHNAGRIIGSLHPQRILLVGSRHVEEQYPDIEIVESESPEEERVPENAVAYMSPDAAQELEVDASSDIYSIGAILYQMLTGQLPFVASSAAAMIVKQLLERPRPPRDLRPEIPPKLQDVMLRSLAKERGDRQQSCAQLKQDLEDALSEIGETRLANQELTGAFKPAGQVSSIKSSPSPLETGWVAGPQGLPPIDGRPQLTGVPAPQAKGSGSRKLVVGAMIGLAILSAMFATVWLLYGVSGSRDTGRPAAISAPPENTRPPSPHAPVNSSRPGASAPSAFPFTVLALLIITAVGGAIVLVLILRRRRTSARSSALELVEPATLPSLQEPLAAPPFVAPVTATPAQPAARQASDAAETIRALEQRPLVREIIKRCPACQMELPTTAQFCVYDGSVLREEVKFLPPKDSPSFYDLQSVETKKRCPTCGAEYPLAIKFCRNDGQKLIEIKSAHQSDDETAEIDPFLIGQYRCFARLGEGGMGMVYKAHHVHLKRLSAVKVLLPQTALIPDAVKMFRREAQLASSINHPNSVIIYDYGEIDAHLFYLAMEFIPGRSLASIIEPKDQSPNPLPLTRTLSITRQICDALDTAHQSGIIHRDLKPQNVMVCERANRPDLAKVVDFGIARSLTVQSGYETLPGTVMGTAAYMSPEQALGDTDLDARSDIFSLGIVVYQMLSGTLPFPVKGLSLWRQIGQRASLKAPPPLLRISHPDLHIPAKVDNVLRHALEPDRHRRTQSAIQFVEELEGAVLS